MAFQPRFLEMVTVLAETVARHGGRPAFGVRGAGGRWAWTSWSELAALVDGFRSALVDLGVGAGDRVAVIANNRIEWVVGCYATFGRGAAYVPMYESMLDRDWQHVLDDCGARVCLVANEGIERRVAALRPDVRQVVLDRDFASLVAHGRARPVPTAIPDPNDIAYFIYTSGTTGRPKGVRLAHRNIAANIQAVDEVLPRRADDVTLAFLPWAHVAGGSTELQGNVYAGTATAICEKTDWLLEALGEVRPTVLFAVPRVWNKIYDSLGKQLAAKPRPIQALYDAARRAHRERRAGRAPSFGDRVAFVMAKRLIFSKVAARFGGRLRLTGSGAAALSPEVAELVDCIGVPFCEVYGMTEVSSLATVTPQRAARFGAVGKALPGVSIRIEPVDGDPAQGGEVIIHGHGVMAGYHNLPEETARALTPDGGIRSGDLGRLDADGYLYITGRVKEIYKLENGKYVSPAPIEERIALSPFVSQCMVHGHNRPHNVAILVPDLTALRKWAAANQVPAADVASLLAEPRVRELYARELAERQADRSYERVGDFLLVAEEFTIANDLLTPTFKVKRRAVIARYEAELDGLYRGRGV